MLSMSPNTERVYRSALMAAGLWDGPVEPLPALDELRRAVEAQYPTKGAPQQQRSSVESYRALIEPLALKGVGPQAIHDRLRQDHAEFRGSISAVKRICLAIKRERGVQAHEVAIPLQTEPGQEAQVDFGSVGHLYDPAEGRLRKAYVFVMVLSYSRHLFARICFDQKVETWLRLHIEAFEHFQGAAAIVVPVVDELRAKLSDRALELDAAREELQEGQQERIKLERELAAIQATKAALAERLEERKAREDALSSELAHARQRNELLSERDRTSVSELARRESELQARNEELQARNKELKSSQNRELDIRAQLDSTVGRERELVRELSHAQATLEALQQAQEGTLERARLKWELEQRAKRGEKP
jgi:hypothetical protein